MDLPWLVSVHYSHLEMREVGGGGDLDTRELQVLHRVHLDHGHTPFPDTLIMNGQYSCTSP